MVHRTHYSLATNPGDLLAWSRAAAPIAQRFAGDKKPALCFTGLSGQAHGFALSLELARNRIDHGLIIVRKEDDQKNHGNRLEVSLDDEAAGYDDKFNFELKAKLLDLYHPIFVDDLISSGSTRIRVVHAINDHGSKEFQNLFRSTCVRGIIDTILKDCWSCENSSDGRTRGEISISAFQEV